MTALAASILAQADARSFAYLPSGRPELTVAAYVAYFLCSVFITVWVGRSLHTNGRLFLVEAFHRDEALADSVNHLLLVGFYLINIGAMLLFLRTNSAPYDLKGVIELLSSKMGWVLLVLGFMHMMNLRALSKMRRTALQRHEPPPVPPAGRLNPAPAQ
jgi:hypothetical protein